MRPPPRRDRLREVEQLAPVVRGEHPLAGGDRGGRVDGAIAREHAGAKEVGGALVDRELEVPEHEAGRNALGERPIQAVDLADLDDPLQHLGSPQPQGDRRDHADQPVAAECEGEELRVVVP